MDPIQQEFDAACIAGEDTLQSMLKGPVLRACPIDRLQQMVWDLERVTARIQREIDTRLDGPVDTA
jgi:hypothetical protein